MWLKIDSQDLMTEKQTNIGTSEAKYKLVKNVLGGKFKIKLRRQDLITYQHNIRVVGRCDSVAIKHRDQVRIVF